MNVMKFGGGVLNSADSVKHFANIIRSIPQPLVIVVSAFNKITTKLENLLKAYAGNDNLAVEENLNSVLKFHRDLIESLGIESDYEQYINKIRDYVKMPYGGDFDFEYDKIVSAGELMSSRIVCDFLNASGIDTTYVDIRNCIKTNSVYREASVNWDESSKRIQERFSEHKIYLTQGFIGQDDKGNTTTLGREGSDFTASVLAYCLDAESVHFWKEVRGIYNADPAEFCSFSLLPKLSYREAVEQVYYGAKILHPKTIKPLQNKKIPILVRPFYEPRFIGTLITDIAPESPERYPKEPVYIIKKKQILISLSPKDFSFIAEDNLGTIFAALAKYRIKVNLMENSAISFSVCVDNNKHKVVPFTEALKSDFNIKHNSDLELITIRHYSDASIEQMTENKKILVRQTSRNTVRFVMQIINKAKK